MNKNCCDFCKAKKGGLYKFDLTFNSFIYVCPDCLSDAVIRKWNQHTYTDIDNHIAVNCDSCSQLATEFVGLKATCDDCKK